MNRPAATRLTSRDRLITAGGALAKQAGFAGTGLDALAAAAEVTSGAFYAQFRSKAELLDAIVSHDLQLMRERFDGGSPAALRTALTRYLSLPHAEQPGQGCSLPALGAEIARAGETTRQHVEEQLLQLHASVAHGVGDDARAWAVLSQAIGAQVIARAMASREARQRVLDAVLAQALATLPTPG